MLPQLSSYFQSRQMGPEEVMATLESKCDMVPLERLHLGDR